jgi:predicted aconitase with swiveling domain
MGSLTWRGQGRPVISGSAAATALWANEPLSFWGGVDPETGVVIDQRHPLAGERLAGKVLVIPTGRGSCSASGVFLESVRNRTAPAAVIVSQVDPIIGLGAVLAEELLSVTVPVLLVTTEDFDHISTGDHVSINHDGSFEVSSVCFASYTG